MHSHEVTIKLSRLHMIFNAQKTRNISTIFLNSIYLEMDSSRTLFFVMLE